MEKYNLNNLGITGLEQIALFGPSEQNIKMIEMYYNASIITRGEELVINDVSKETSDEIFQLIKALLKIVRSGYQINQKDVIQIIQLAKNQQLDQFDHLQESIIGKLNDGTRVHPKTIGQLTYLNALNHHDIIFCIGPAGTGKTYLAVIHAVYLLKMKIINKIILTRPAVEAGESLGFLPGDLKEKVDPYLRPLYDALDDALGKENTEKMIEKGIIEIAPLAYMRGRTLENAYIILDEGQNTTLVQMKMFLTRLGFNSKMVITGDVTQVDLRNHVKSGLDYVSDILKDIKEIAFVYLTSIDIMRHPLVQKIIDSYDKNK